MIDGEFALKPRWCGYVNAIQRDGVLLKALWRTEYPRENEGLAADEVAIVLGRALPDGRTFRYRLAIPEADADVIFSRRRPFRLDMAQRIFALSVHERDEFFQRRRWRRREGRPTRPALL
jgi:hypothetical protein